MRIIANLVYYWYINRKIYNLKNDKKRKGAAEVAIELRTSIHKGTFQHLERLPSERVLCDEYGVSRGTIREALTRLENENLVEIRAGSGTYITYKHDVEDFQIIANARPLELIDTRFALEPHICRLVVLHAHDSDIAKLEAFLEQMDTLENDTKKFAEIDTEFHSALVESTGNALLIWIISQINNVRVHDRWAYMRRVTLNPEIIHTYNAQHRLIVNAIKQRDPETAASQMKVHLETARLSLTRAAEA